MQDVAHFEKQNDDLKIRPFSPDRAVLSSRKIPRGLNLRTGIVAEGRDPSASEELCHWTALGRTLTSPCLMLKIEKRP